MLPVCRCYVTFLKIHQFSLLLCLHLVIAWMLMRFIFPVKLGKFQIMRKLQLSVTNVEAWIILIIADGLGGLDQNQSGM